MKSEELNKKIKQCCQCFLHGTCTNIVPGEGNPHAEIMFIGEAPGAQEDKVGRPFVGTAGKFLDEMLSMIGFSRNNIFITNMLKCRPPRNRDPLSEEVEACWPWLLEQIGSLKPKLVVTLGRHALEQFFPNQKISKVHGHVMEGKVTGIGRQVFYVLYHPASAIYQKRLRNILIEDFKRLPKVLDLVRKGNVDKI
ncbi:MAG: uracil-DNA glycosylase [Deltaproteobacteria bacterium]|nr:MAG: uracil-DNA glycosylase [Deltaproteobacteria bacterium]